MRYLVIAFGGLLGANVRYTLGGWIAERYGTRFPYGTLVINVTGSFILGFFLTLIPERIVVHPYWRRNNRPPCLQTPPLPAAGHQREVDDEYGGRRPTGADLYRGVRALGAQAALSRHARISTG